MPVPMPTVVQSPQRASCHSRGLMHGRCFRAWGGAGAAFERQYVPTDAGLACFSKKLATDWRVDGSSSMKRTWPALLVATCSRLIVRLLIVRCWIESEAPSRISVAAFTMPTFFLLNPPLRHPRCCSMGS
jgi:hypothetical protein